MLGILALLLVSCGWDKNNGTDVLHKNDETKAKLPYSEVVAGEQSGAAISTSSQTNPTYTAPVGPSWKSLNTPKRP